MSDVGQIERKAQDRVVGMIRDELGYEYLGNWEYREGNANVETELLVFPGEDHELTRSGTPWHRRQRFEAVLDWWQRHLPARRAADDG